MSKHDAFLSPKTPNTAKRHDGWSLDRQAAFLRSLSATHSVTQAAKSVSMSRQSAYRLRSKLKGRAFDLAWEVAFHHSYDVLAHAALDRALNGVEVPVYFQGEQVGSYRKFDERLTVALLGKVTQGGNPMIGRLGPSAEKHARDFEALLGCVESGEAVETGAPAADDPGELEALRAAGSGRLTYKPAMENGPVMDERDDWDDGNDWDGEDVGDEGPVPCPSALSDAELAATIQEGREELRK